MATLTGLEPANASDVTGRCASQLHHRVAKKKRHSASPLGARRRALSDDCTAEGLSAAPVTPDVEYPAPQHHKVSSSWFRRWEAGSATSAPSEIMMSMSYLPERFLWRAGKDSNPHRLVLETSILPIGIPTRLFKPEGAGATCSPGRSTEKSGVPPWIPQPTAGARVCHVFPQRRTKLTSSLRPLSLGTSFGVIGGDRTRVIPGPQPGA